jgi:hypothetical protein
MDDRVTPAMTGFASSTGGRSRKETPGRVTARFNRMGQTCWGAADRMVCATTREFDAKHRFQIDATLHETLHTPKEPDFEPGFAKFVPDPARSRRFI